MVFLAAGISQSIDAGKPVLAAYNNEDGNSNESGDESESEIERSEDDLEYANSVTIAEINESWLSIKQGINECRRIRLIRFGMLPSNAKFYIRIN